MILNNWFECKVKSMQVVESGAQKMVQNAYLVDAMNFTEAETRIIREITPFCNGQLEVVDIKRARYSEVFQTDADDADKYYKVKCMFVVPDEKTQTIKKTANNMLVQAANLRDAVKRFDEGMSGSMMDYEIHTVQETNIADLFPYQATETKTKESDTQQA